MQQRHGWTRPLAANEHALLGSAQLQRNEFAACPPVLHVHGPQYPRLSEELPLFVRLSSERALQAVRQDCSFAKETGVSPCAPGLVRGRSDADWFGGLRFSGVSGAGRRPGAARRGAGHAGPAFASVVGSGCQATVAVRLPRRLRCRIVMAPTSPRALTPSRLAAPMPTSRQSMPSSARTGAGCGGLTVVIASRSAC